MIILCLESTPLDDLIYSISSASVLSNEWVNFAYQIIKGFSAPSIILLFGKYFINKKNKVIL